ncbi:MAG: DUF2007 domain-containing protein [Anaerolineae bacterium]|nr:DUF2007 domain-containing protein [Anaerolineae bacterium]
MLRAALAAQSEFVTIATFSHPVQAHIVKARLEAEGIWAFVADESTITANWLMSIALGGVRLQVNGKDAENALDILDQAPEPIEWEEEDADGEEESGDSNDPEKCPRCGSPDIRYEKYTKRLVFLSWLLLGFPIPFLRREWECKTCGLIWKP